MLPEITVMGTSNSLPCGAFERQSLGIGPIYTPSPPFTYCQVLGPEPGLILCSGEVLTNTLQW